MSTGSLATTKPPGWLIIERVFALNLFQTDSADLQLSGLRFFLTVSSRAVLGFDAIGSPFKGKVCIFEFHRNWFV